MRKHFATTDEIREKTVRININDAIKALNEAIDTDDENALRDARIQAAELCPKGGPLVYCNADGTSQVMDDDSHSITFASTGKGKTRRFIYPSIYSDILSGTNIVVNDMKGEIYQTTKSLLDAMGYHTYVFDLRDPANSPNHYNPLSLAWEAWQEGNRDKASMVIRSLGLCIIGQYQSKDDPFWNNAAQDYFAGLALSMLECDATKDSFTIESLGVIDLAGYEMVTSAPASVRNHSDPDSLPRAIDLYVDALDEGSMAKRFLSGTISAPPRTLSSIMSVFRQPMSLYVGHEGMMDALGFCDFSAKSLTDPKTAVFVISPDETRVFGAIVVSVLNQLMSELITIAQNEFGGILPRRVDFFLDEMGNLPAPIPDMDALVSASRSRGLRFHFVLQSVNQLSSVYGEQLSQVIQDNCDTWLYMGTKSLGFLSQLSEMCGTVQMESGTTRKLLPVDVLQHLETRRQETETLVLLGSLRPYVTPLKDIGFYERAPKPPDDDARSKTERRRHQTFDFGGFIGELGGESKRNQRKSTEVSIDAGVFVEQEAKPAIHQARSRNAASHRRVRTEPKKRPEPSKNPRKGARPLSAYIYHFEENATMAQDASKKLRLMHVNAATSDCQPHITRPHAFQGQGADAVAFVVPHEGFADRIPALLKIASLKEREDISFYLLLGEGVSMPHDLPKNVSCIQAQRSLDAIYLARRLLESFADDDGLASLLVESLIQTLEGDGWSDEEERQANRDALNLIHKLKRVLSRADMDRLWKVQRSYQSHGLSYSQAQFLRTCLDEG